MAVELAGYRRRTMAAYDRLSAQLSEGYDAYFAAVAQMEADRLMACLTPGSTILDLGCGAGVASSYFAGHGFRAVPADLSAGMLVECARRGLRRLVRLDLEDLPFAPRSFAAVWAHTSLIHIPKGSLTRALAGVSELLRPGGRLFVALREGVGEGFGGEPGTKRWFANYRPEEFERALPASLQLLSAGSALYGRRTFLNYHLSSLVTGSRAADSSHTSRPGT